MKDSVSEHTLKAWNNFSVLWPSQAVLAALIKQYFDLVTARVVLEHLLFLLEQSHALIPHL